LTNLLKSFIDKPPKGNAFIAPKMECADNYEGRIRALPGLCTWGYRARTRGGVIVHRFYYNALPFKSALCKLLLQTFEDLKQFD
jgi:hypothetical protein